MDQGLYESIAQDRVIWGTPDAATAVAELIKALGLPSRLRDLDIDKDQFPGIAEGAMENLWVRNNPRPINSPDDIMEILESAY